MTTPPNRNPAYWGQGLPAPGTGRRAPNPAWRAIWMIWCAAWALFWITAGWLVLPLVNVLAFVASLAAMLAFDRMTPRGHLPPPPPAGPPSAGPPAAWGDRR
jgi:hypothetical protein